MKTLTLVLAPRKPRNPLVAATHFRQAGRHGNPGGGSRQQARLELRREVDRLRPSP